MKKYFTFLIFILIFLLMSCENLNKTYPKVRVHRSWGSYKYFAYGIKNEDETYTAISDWLYADKNNYSEYLSILTTGEFYLLADDDNAHVFCDAYYLNLFTLDYGYKYSAIFDGTNRMLLITEMNLY